jgi:hypothetical protein
MWKGCYAEALMNGIGAISSIFALLYLGLIIFVVWQVISSLNRISRGVEDIAITLRRMESKEQQPSPHN